jgi:hypothetical protein
MELIELIKELTEYLDSKEESILLKLRKDDTLKEEVQDSVRTITDQLISFAEELDAL